MYTFDEVRKIFARCVNMEELEKACDGFLLIIKDGDFSPKLQDYTKLQSHIRFRQLKCT